MAEAQWSPDATVLLTIPNGQSVSEILDLRSNAKHGLWGIGISNEDTSFNGIINITVFSQSLTDVGVLLQSNGLDIEVNAQRAFILEPFPFLGLQFVASTNQTVDRVFKIIGFAR